MKGFAKLTERFNANDRPKYYDQIIAKYEEAAANVYGGQLNIAAIIEEYRIAETLVRKQDRVKLASAVCKDYFKNFFNGIVYTLLANGVLQPDKVTGEDGQVTEVPPKVEIIAPDEVKDYAFDEQDLWDFFRKVIVPKMMIDPNGLAVAIPYGEGLRSNDTAPEVKIWYVPFKDINYISGEETIFSYGSFYYYINKQEYKRFSLVKNKVVLDKSWSYPHNLGYVPYRQLGGIVADYDAMVTDESDFTNSGDDFYLLVSYISHAFDKATLCCRVHSDIEIMRQTHTHPYIEMESEPCRACNGMGCMNMSVMPDSCECRGDRSGEVKPTLPIGAVLYRKKSNFDDHKEVNKPLLTFTAPDISAIEFQLKYLKEYKDEVKESLNLFRSDQMQSGVAKQLDDNPRQMAVAEIAGNLYGLLEECLQWINDLRKVSNEIIEINLPESWRVKI